MKTFKLSIFKGHQLKQTKEIKASSLKELNEQKNAFWAESPYKKGVNKNWMGVKRIR